MIEQIELIPKKTGHLVLPPRPTERYITLHYSGVEYNDMTSEQEKARILMEARYQINKNWGSDSKNPIYGDGLMYDYVVLKSGEIIKTRRARQQLWHCGNNAGNKASWSVHVMYGGLQKLTKPQREALFDLFDQLRKQCDIPRENVFGHCEWPRGVGSPVQTSSYKPLPGQSICPGPEIIKEVYRYRATSDTYSRNIHMQVVGNIPSAPVYTDRSSTSPKAVIEDKYVQMWPGSIIELDDVTNGWGHISTHIGFINMAYLKEIGSVDPAEPPVIADSLPVIREYSELSSIIVQDQPVANVQAIVDYLANLPAQHYTREDLTIIVGAYKRLGEETGVDWIAALAQNLHETDNMRSWWSQRPRRNPAGLRVTGERRHAPPKDDPNWSFNDGTQQWHKGMIFASWEDSVKAHIAYLLSYACTNDQLTPLQKDFILSSNVAFVFSRSVNRGVAPTLKGLNGRWAVPGTTYATRIAAMANTLVKR